MSKWHSEKEVKWIISKINKFGGHVPNSEVIGICEEYHKKFGKAMSASGMGNWARRTANKQLGIKPKVGEKKVRSGFGNQKKVMKIFLISNYIVFAGGGVYGFEKTEEVVEFVKNSQMIGGVRLFKNLPVKIECNVKFE